MVWISLIILAITVYAIVKNYETRTVLIVSGLTMSLIGGDVMGGLNAFVKDLANFGIVTVICSVMGFSYVMDYTGCSKHLVRLATSCIGKAKFILLPGTVIITFVLGIALPSCAGICAAVGAILIPLLMQNGIHPAAAASAVFLGSWGCVLTPGNVFIIQVANLVKGDPVAIMIGYAPQVAIALIVSIAVFLIIIYMKKENSGYIHKDANIAATDEKLNLLKALMPILPIILIVLGNKSVGLLPVIDVPQAMILCAILAYFVTRPNYAEFTKKFFRGAGDSYCEIIGIIAAAALFTQGMKIIGLTGALIDIMKNSQEVARLAAAFGPFVVAVVSGSGVAATLAFNGAVTPHAAQFGFSVIDMGSVAQLTGMIGRSMSPIAGGALICAKLAGINPIEITKRNALPTIMAAVIVMMICM